MSRSIDVGAFEAGVLRADRAYLGRAITLVESTRPDHQVLAQELLTRLLPHSGGSHRVGISGVPGAGKSTFIDALGSQLTNAGHHVAVLAVDPSSKRTGGSILGDKTRMSQLAVDPNAFIRPSPTSGILGGVTKATRESIVVVEAAGFDVVIVETVGVGQSETAVANMVDSFLLLMVARTGDGLQGIKKGVLELADVIAVNKADGDNVVEAGITAGELSAALHLMAASPTGWNPPVMTCSAVEKTNLSAVWQQLTNHRVTLDKVGELAARRRRQNVDWMWATIDDQLLLRFRSSETVKGRAAAIEESVRMGTMSPTAAARELLDLA